MENDCNIRLPISTLSLHAAQRRKAVLARTELQLPHLWMAGSARPLSRRFGPFARARGRAKVRISPRRETSHLRIAVNGYLNTLINAFTSFLGDKLVKFGALSRSLMVQFWVSISFRVEVARALAPKLPACIANIPLKPYHRQLPIRPTKANHRVT